MKLLYPEFLWLLIPLALFTWATFRSDDSSVRRLHPKIILRNGRSRLVRLAPYLALAWMLLALARPVLPRGQEVKTPALSTVFLAVDASRSMTAKDLQPTRYRFALATVRQLLRRDRGHRFALIFFTSNPLLVSPPTEDAALIEAAMGAFNPAYVLTRGTSVAALLAFVSRFEGAQKELVIFSDGGDEKESRKWIEIALKGGIRVHAVACATREGARVPGDNGWLKDDNGHLVISALNPALADLTQQTGGEFIETTDPAEAAAALLKGLRDEARKQKGRQTLYRELFWLPLGIGLLFLTAGTLALPSRRFPFKVLGRFMPALAAMAVFGVFLKVPLAAGWLDIWRLDRGYEAYKKGDYNASLAYFKAVDPPLLESLYAMASAYYKMGAYKKAGRLFLKCKTANPDLKRRIWYNLGNCAMKLGHYQSARDYYVKALQLGYDADAARNLELALFLNERRQKRVEPKAEGKVKAESSSATADQRDESAKKGAGRQQTARGGGRSGSSAAQIAKQKRPVAGSSRMELGSKAYEVINKGYVHEARPW